MVVMRRERKNPEYLDHQLYDLSFMYSKHCDLACTFCMYSSNPQVHDRLNIQHLRRWLKTLRWSWINAIGIYGGEPTLFLDENRVILDLCNGSVPRFMITNGTWSQNIIDTTRVMLWAQNYHVKIFVSGTDQHVPFQNRAMLEMLARDYPTQVRLKGPDTQILPMGNLLGAPVRCTEKCMRARLQAPTRIAIQPDGTIIYQTCDGVYPVIGSIEESFDILNLRIREMQWRGFKEVCPYYGRGKSQMASGDATLVSVQSVK